MSILPTITAFERASTVIKDPLLAALVVNHAQAQRPSYRSTYAAPSPQAQRDIWDKLCSNATIPGFDMNPIALIPMDQFTLDDIQTMMWFLEKQGVSSEFTFLSSPQGASLHLSISDAKNQFIISEGRKAPVTAITEHRDRLHGTATINSMIAPIQMPPPREIATHNYIPPFNVSDGKGGAYILIEHMSGQHIDLLKKALTSNEIVFTERTSDSKGDVLVVGLVHLEKLGVLQKYARTEQNENNAPQPVGMVILDHKACPAINLIHSGRDEIFIPIEGMTPHQPLLIQQRLQASGIPSVRQNNDAYGLVLAVQVEFADELEKVRDTLRKEDNIRKQSAHGTGARIESLGSVDLELS